MAGAPGPRRPPTVAVCIPTQGRPSLTSVALPSVLPQLAADDQVVVAFHGTAPDPAVVGLDPRVVAVRHDGPTVTSTRNAAAAAARSDVLVFLDDDDESGPGALASARALMADPEVVVASGAVERVTPTGTTRLAPAPGDELHRGETVRFLAGAFAVRRAAFEAIGGYDERLRFSENHELGVRLVGHAHDRGARLAHTDALWLRYHPSAATYSETRVEAIGLVLATHGHLLPARSRTRADLHAVASVQQRALGDHAASRRSAWRAVRARPTEPRHLARALARSVPRVRSGRGR